MPNSETRFKSLSSITKGASLFLIGKAIVDILRFILELVLSRSFGAGLYGIYAYGYTIMRIGLVFTNVGTDKSVLKYIPRYEGNNRRSFVFGLATLTSILGGGFVAGILFLVAPTISSYTLGSPLLVQTLRLFSVILVFDTISRVVYSVFRSVERMEYEVVSNRIFKPAMRLSSVLIALLLGGSLFTVMVALTVASFLALVFAFYILIRNLDLRPKLRSDSMNREEIYEFFNFSLPVTFKDISDVFIRRIDLLMVGYFFSSAIVGFYNISVLVATILVLPLSAFNQLFPPIASRLYAERDFTQLNSLYNTVTRWTFTTSLILGVTTIVYRHEILSLFGDEFTRGSLVLTLFVLGQLMNCLGGANGFLLMMTDHQYVLVLNQWVFGLVNVVLNYVFILRFGFVGAALATAGILVVLNIAITAELWYLEGLFPYSLNFAKPLIAGAAATAVLVIIGLFLAGIPLLLVGGCLGVATYAVMLYGLGIEQEDRQFFTEIVAQRL